MRISMVVLSGSVLTAAWSGSLSGQVAAGHGVGWPADSAAVSAAVGRFLTAFENLDWEPFRASFADDATAFFPTPEPAERFAGRAAIEAQFQKVFAGIRSGARTGPPFQRLAPDDLRIERLGSDAALVTFLLHNTQRVARRTLVMVRTPDGWRIRHLHASNVAVGP